MQVTGPIFFLALFFLSLAGCAGSEPNAIELIREDGYKVTVKADGVEQKKFEEQLVHRVSVSRSQINQAVQNWPHKLNLPFTASGERDLRGKPTGLRIDSVTQAPELPALGLQKGDVVTAVGVNLAANERDLWKLFDELQRNKQATMTFIRGGRPHKALYYLDERAGS